MGGRRRLHIKGIPLARTRLMNIRNDRLRRILTEESSGDGTPHPTFTNVQFLVNANGADTTTSFTDLSNSAHVITNVGTMTNSTDQFKFGTSSVKFGDGSSDYFTMPAQLDTDMDYFNAANIFTAEAWVYPTALDELQTIFGHRSATDGWDCYIAATDGSMYIQAFGTSVIRVNEQTATGVISANEWTHVAVEKNLTEWKLFVNGALVASATASGSVGQSTRAWLGNTFTNSTRDFIGYMDAIRYTEGENVYSFAAFDVPTEAPQES